MGIGLTAKIEPKNDAFTGMVDADQVLGGGDSGTLPDATVAESNVTQHEGALSVAESQISDTVAIGTGGTGQTTQTAAFDALAPTTTKGDVIVHNGSDNIRVAVGTNDHVLTADSGEASGVKWAEVTGGSGVSESLAIAYAVAL